MVEAPSGYHIDIYRSHRAENEWLASNDGLRSFRLTDRPFADSINHYLGHLPSQILDLMTGQRDRLPVAVLDIGGGRRSRCAGEIAARYGYGVQVTNLEFMPAIVTRPNGVRYIEGNICDMWQIPNGSVDFAYTYQVLPNFEFGSEESERALVEIARVLSPGGVALIDEPRFSQFGPRNPRIYAFETTNHVLLQGRTGNYVEKGKIAFGAVYWTFLIMAKEPVNPELLLIREKLVTSI